MKKNNLFGALKLLLNRFFAVFAAIGTMLNKDNVVFCSQILWLALFSLLIAVTFSITDFLAKKDLAAVLVRAVHFVLSYLSFLATFVWGGAAESYFKSNTALTNRIFMVVCMSFLFIGVYAAAGVLRLAYLSFVRRKNQTPDEYHNIYSDLDTNSNK